jgi:hypothetical protein
MSTTSAREIRVQVDPGCIAEHLLVHLRTIEPQHDAEFWEFVGAVARHEFVKEVVVNPDMRAGVYPESSVVIGDGQTAEGEPPYTNLESLPTVAQGS